MVEEASKYRPYEKRTLELLAAILVFLHNAMGGGKATIGLADLLPEIYNPRTPANMSSAKIEETNADARKQAASSMLAAMRGG